MTALSPKEKRFIAEYLHDQNGTQAAIRSGYSKRSASQIAARLLAKDKIRDSIDTQLKKIEDKGIVTKEYILQGLKEVADRCMQRVPVMVRDPQDGRRMIQKTDIETGEGVWEFDSMGANKALELLGKHIRFFPAERRELSGRDGEPLIPPAKAPDLSQIKTADLIAHVKARGGAECAPHS